jgi:outer membrane protein assembly factor BamB
MSDDSGALDAACRDASTGASTGAAVSADVNVLAARRRRQVRSARSHVLCGDMPDITCSRRAAVVCVLLLIGAGVRMRANEWPGLWGPARNGTVPGSLQVSNAAVDVLWRRPVSGGYSELVIVNGRVYTLEMRDGVDHIVAVDAQTGRQLWTVNIGPTYRGHGGSDDGPISTPAVEGPDVFALGPRGQLIAVDAATGKERWRHDLVGEFAAAPPTWGFAASPLVEGRLVIVPTGGPNSRGLLAFDRASGKLAWNAAVARATAYSSAISATIAGARQVVAVASDRVYGVNPGDGRVLWSAPGPGGNAEVSNSAVVLPGDRLLLSTWEESVVLRLSREGGSIAAREAWRSNRLRNSNGPTIYRNGFLYGFAGPILLCVNAETQEVTWRERTGAGSLIAVGEQLVVLGQDSGEMIVADISPERFAVRQRLKVLQEGTRAVTGPSFDAGRLYVRNLREIVALRLR